MDDKTFIVIPTYPKYGINRLGEVLGPRGWVLKPQDSAGYMKVTLSNVLGTRQYFVHRLMAHTFLNMDLDDYSVHVDHKDEVKSNNFILNLQPLTPGRNKSKSNDFMYSEDTDELKKCHKCNMLILRSQYNDDKISRDKLRDWCKPCMTKYNLRRNK